MTPKPREEASTWTCVRAYEVMAKTSCRVQREGPYLPRIVRVAAGVAVVVDDVDDAQAAGVESELRYELGAYSERLQKEREKGGKKRGCAEGTGGRLARSARHTCATMALMTGECVTSTTAPRPSRWALRAASTHRLHEPRTRSHTLAHSARWSSSREDADAVERMEEAERPGRERNARVKTVGWTLPSSPGTTCNTNTRPPTFPVSQRHVDEAFVRLHSSTRCIVSSTERRAEQSRAEQNKTSALRTYPYQRVLVDVGELRCGPGARQRRVEDFRDGRLAQQHR